MTTSLSDARGGQGVGGHGSEHVDSVRTLKQEPPARLRIINDDKLKATRRVRKAFLDHPQYTPTQSTILTEALNGPARPGPRVMRRRR
jgi:hypothetical protein